MTNWKHQVDFTHFWQSDETVEEKAKKAVIELTKLKKKVDDPELEEITLMFDAVSGDGGSYTVTDDFNDRMYDLYEWADANLVWVKTIF